MTRIRGRFVVAVETVEGITDEARPTFGREHPRPFRERRIVADVLPVTADQNRAPIADLILFKPDDLLLHSFPNLG